MIINSYQAHSFGYSLSSKVITEIPKLHAIYTNYLLLLLVFMMSISVYELGHDLSESGVSGNKQNQS